MTSLLLGIRSVASKRCSPPTKISTTDPEAALSSKRGASEFAYYDNYLIDNRSCIIAGVVATPARLSQRNHCGPTDVGKSKRTVRTAARQRHC